MTWKILQKARFTTQMVIFFSLVFKDDKVVKMSATDNSHLEDPTVCIGNHMVSSAIWDKSAQVNFSKRKSFDYLLIIHIHNFTLQVDVKLIDICGRLPSIPC